MTKISEQGSTLIFVLWVLIIIGIIASFIFFRSELEWAAVSNLENQTQARRIAEDTLNKALVLFATDDTDSDNATDLWYYGGRKELEQDGYKITLIVEDEGSKPNLNLIQTEGFKEILPSGISPEAILDWRDADDDVRSNGAENTYYQGLNPPYKARNGFFSTLSELKQIKNGLDYFNLLAPEFTVYGKTNPNTIDGDTFTNLLLSSGFEKNWVDRVSTDFVNYRSKSRFANIDDFLKLNSVTIQSRDQLKSLFTFDGACNINLISKTGLRVLLRNYGLSTDLAKTLINRRDQQPFENTSDIDNIFKSQKAGFNVADYFSTITRIVHYRIWVTKEQFMFYLNAVYQREPGNFKEKWKVSPLGWQIIFNKDIPEIPKSPEQTDTQTDAKNGGG